MSDADKVIQYDMGQPGWEAVHEYFGLTYANYLVLPRSVLQCMPNDWQTRFVQMLRELHGTFDLSDNYRVLLLDKDDHYEDSDTPDHDRANVIHDPLSNYRHPDWTELAKRLQPNRATTTMTESIQANGHDFDPGDHAFIEIDHLCHSCGRAYGEHARLEWIDALIVGSEHNV